MSGEADDAAGKEYKRHRGDLVERVEGVETWRRGKDWKMARRERSGSMGVIEKVSWNRKRERMEEVGGEDEGRVFKEARKRRGRQ